MLGHFSHVRLFATLWIAARQAPLSVGILQARILDWIAMPSSRGSSQSRSFTSPASTGVFFTTSAPWETQDMFTLGYFLPKVGIGKL